MSERPVHPALAGRGEVRGKPLDHLFSNLNGPLRQAVTDPLAPRLQTLTSPSGKRAYPRLNLPLAVDINGGRYQASNWSLGGLRLRDGPPAKAGDLFKLTLHLDFASFQVALELMGTAVVVASGKGLGFQFVDVPADKARVLRLVSDKWLAGELVNFTDVLSEGREGARLTFTDRSTRRLQRSATVIRFTVLMATIAAALAAGIYYIVDSVLTVRSEYAAVSAVMTIVRMPENGFVTGSPLAIGTSLKRDQVIGTVEPAVTPQAQTDIDTQISVAEAQLAQQRAALAAATLGFDAFKRTAVSDLAKAHTARTLLERQVDAEQRVYDRIKTAVAQGDMGQAQADQEEVKLTVLRNGLNEARATEFQATQVAQAAEKGLYTTNGFSTQQTPAQLEQAVHVTEAQLARLRGMLAAMKSRLVIRSPCDCSVSAVLAQVGEFMVQGTPIYRLGAQAGRTVEIDVLVPNDRMHFLALGQQAKVVLANSTTSLAAHITGISFNPAIVNRVGLPDTLRSFGQFSLVTIALDEPVGPTAPVNGLPASVSFSMSAGMLLDHLTGIGWFADRNPALLSGTATGTASIPPPH